MRDFKIYISIGIALLLVYVVAQYNKPNPTSWDTTLQYNDKIPFGTYILYNRLNDIFPAATVTRTNRSAYRVFNDSTMVPGNYLITAKAVNFSKTDYAAMVKFISRGNSVLISTFDMSDALADTLKLSISNEFGKHSPFLNFTSRKVNKDLDYQFDKHIADQYFSKFDTAKAVVLGRNEYGNSNFIRYRYGKGNLFLFANPQLLTNYSLLKPMGADYASKVLSYLPANVSHVYWDQFQNHDIAVNTSPMRVFFEYAALRWAYYIALAGMLLFVIYEVKRRQRIIPIVDPLTNSTLEFVNVVGKVYYEQRDNANIASKKIVYFSEHLRNTFGIKAGTFQREFVDQLASKTGIDDQFADELVRYINYLLPQSKVTDQELITLNQLIEKFHKQSGS
ncbi:DUF4350 domain-containing protein [Mucilaginibacter terrenus]|uniref:DUF4350 domain-containing protein n=1 Tax=Mucilaginibacter terrenus TaxID=2482727 RepID=A0A3E2NJM7_9SPHI|nr:DUF4350 domain-containing protein [Mucilaginibacter terrenus]RFZ81202.1 DUF4350 domain-containing protein [Mucilaginibacter terrenus]